MGIQWAKVVNNMILILYIALLITLSVLTFAVSADFGRIREIKYPRNILYSSNRENYCPRKSLKKPKFCDFSILERRRNKFDLNKARADLLNI